MRSTSMHFRQLRELLPPILLLLVVTGYARSQTSAFNYQGRLTDSGTPASGIYDMQFKLFDSLGGGSQIGSTLTNASVQVASGIFILELDFGGSPFDGSARYLEMGVRSAGSANPYTILTPRQQISSTPYAIRTRGAMTADSLSKLCAGCVNDSQINSIAGTKVSGVIPVASVPGGSGNYIQNTTLQQSNASFTIGGDGTAGGTLSASIVNSTSQYNIGGNRVLSIAGGLFPNSDTSAGVSAGTSNAPSGSTSDGNLNSFFGSSAGNMNSTGCCNSFFGAQAGLSNTSGLSNSFFGINAGNKNVAGSRNSFFGDSVGFNNQNDDNSFSGYHAGLINTADSNSFFGSSAGSENKDGSQNSFFGFQSGQKNTTGSSNSFFGSLAGTANDKGAHNAFFGDNAGSANSGSFNSFFGSASGESNTTSIQNSFFGSGAGAGNQTGHDNAFFGNSAGAKSTGSNNTMIGSFAGFSLVSGDNNIYVGSDGVSSESNTIRIGLQAGQSTTFIAGIKGAGVVGSSVLITSSGQLGVLASSRRFKENIHQMGRASEGLMRLRPVTFFYRPEYSQAARTLQYGLIAEEVAKVYPDLVQRSADGKPFTVLYHLLTPMLLNELQKQQQQIKAQAEAITYISMRLARVEALSARRSRRRR